MSGPAPWLEIEQIIGRLRFAVDQVMDDGGLYDERSAARAFRQAEGDPVAAADLVRALRASLPRFGAAQPVERGGSPRPGDGDEPPGGPSQSEVRHSEIPVVVTHPGTGEAVTIGHVRVTEAEILVERAGRNDGSFAFGYGVALGHNDRRAVALAQLGAGARHGGGGDLGGQPVRGPAEGVSAAEAALLEQLRRPGGCGAGSARVADR